MASADRCEAALRELAGRLERAGEDTRRRLATERTLACTITDLDVTFRARLRDGLLQDLERGDPGGAQLRLRVASDDLIALTDGTLPLPQAWLSGRLRVSASLGDLLLLRGLL